MLATPQVKLVPVTAENWHACAELSVADGQRAFLPPNVYSIAAAQFYPDATCRAVVDAGGVPVGFCMYGIERPAERVKVFRLMIAAEHQRRGLGTAALSDMLREIAARWPGRPVYVSYQQENGVARRLYDRFGFAVVEQADAKVTACQMGNATV